MPLYAMRSVSDGKNLERVAAAGMAMKLDWVSIIVFIAVSILLYLILR